jgi:MYXO-CTERM domain-containing protein
MDVVVEVPAGEDAGEALVQILLPASEVPSGPQDCSGIGVQDEGGEWLPHWIKPPCSVGTLEVWVELPDAAPATVRVVSDAGAPPAAPHEVFPFFDEFDDPDGFADRWANVSPTQPAPALDPALVGTGFAGFRTQGDGLFVSERTLVFDTLPRTAGIPHNDLWIGCGSLGTLVPLEFSGGVGGWLWRFASNGLYWQGAQSVDQGGPYGTIPDAGLRVEIDRSTGDLSVRTLLSVATVGTPPKGATLSACSAVSLIVDVGSQPVDRLFLRPTALRVVDLSGGDPGADEPDLDSAASNGLLPTDPGCGCRSVGGPAPLALLAAAALIRRRGPRSPAAPR